MIKFTWDPKKSAQNQKKHGVSFEEAQSAFFDESALEFADPDHSAEEDRFILLGRSFLLRMLVVCHCHREKEGVVRLISARKATPKERGSFSRRGRP